MCINWNYYLECDLFIKRGSYISLVANRTEPNLSDLAQAFGNLGVDLADLSEFLKEVESSPLNPNIPRFPVPRKSSHVYSGPASFGEASKRRLRAPSLSSEDEEYDHIPPYLPPLPSQHEEDKGIIHITRIFPTDSKEFTNPNSSPFRLVKDLD